MTDLKIAEFDRDEPVTHERLERLRKAANNGDANALTELKSVLKSHPELRKMMGDLMGCTREAMLHLLSPEDAVYRESLAAQFESDTKTLEAEGSGTALERLLIEHLLMTRLRVVASGLGVMGQLTARAKRGDARFWSGRDDKAHRHYAESVKMLVEARQVLGLQKPNLLSPAESDETQELATVEM